MGLSCFVSGVNISGNGNFSISGGINFQPKFLLTTSNATVYGQTGVVTSRFSLGCMDSSGNQRSISFCDVDNLANQVAFRRWSNTSINQHVDSSRTAFLHNFSGVSLDANGFTINAITNSGTGQALGFMAIGGTDVSGVTVGDFTIGAGAASTEVVLGYPVTGLILYSAVTTSGTDITHSHWHHTVGFTDGTRHKSTTNVSQDIVGTSVTDRSHSSTHAFEAMTIGPGTIDGSSTVTLTSSGFRLNHDDTYASGYIVCYAAFSGPRFNAGTFIMPTTATTVDVTGVGFQPSGLLMTSIFTESNLGDDGEFTSSQAKFGFAITSSTNLDNQFSLMAQSDDAAATTNANKVIGARRAFIRTNNSTTITASGHLSALSADGFTMSKTLATNNSSNHVHFLAIGALPEPTASSYPKINVSGIWRNVSAMNINVDGNWRTVTNPPLINVNGNWRNIVS
jgi:hypothetical protein